MPVRTLYPGAALALATSLLCGCGLNELQSVAAPTPLQVADYINEMRRGAEAVKGMTPREYLTASIVHSNQKCKEFFVELAEYRRRSAAVDRLVNIAAAAGAPLFPIYDVSQRSQTIFTAALTSVAALNEAVREIYAFGPYATEISQKVTEAQNVYLADKGTRLAIRIVSEYSSRELASYLRHSATGNTFAPIPQINFVVDINAITRDEAMLLARYVAQGYAYQCSVANINSLVRTSIANARIGNVVSTPSEGVTGALTQPVPSAVQVPVAPERRRP
jgi:hypothetical protein